MNNSPHADYITIQNDISLEDYLQSNFQENSKQEPQIINLTVLILLLQ